jgi:hypothetical protein
MRGNHRIWGRNDYNEPAPMTQEQRDQAASVTVTRSPGFKTWHDVFLNGKHLGRVSSRPWGQFFRAADMPGHWDNCLAVRKWNSADPPHGWSVLRLIELQATLETR